MPAKFIPFITILAFVSLGGCALLGAMWFVDRQKIQTENERLQALVSQERDYKAQLQEMLDSNLNTSSELTLAVDTLIKELETYDSEVKRSFRVLNGETQILPGANGKVLQDSQEQVQIELNNTEAKLSTSIKQKDDINNRVNAIFGSSNQNLQNRADPRDGVRK